MPNFVLDPQIDAFNKHAYDTPLIQDVWRDKYLQKGEQSPEDAYRRVAKAIANAPCEHNPKKAEDLFYELMVKRLFLPGGRILAGAGTSKRVTLMNCYVNCTLDDSMEGIMEGVSNLALTSQQGGGVGTAFETLRPTGAILKRTQSAASGPLPFMDVFNQTGKTIRSAGERRAAQMGTISDTHPDMPAFVKAKGEGLLDGSKRFAEFNLSILVSDAFLAAVEDDEEWLLYFHIPPVARDSNLAKHDFEDERGILQYVYSVWQARELWDLITKYTYEFSDPGVIFIDRINELNNLQYCETIRCTNPCGEQPLPPHGTCNLGAINVAQIVRNPFTSDASIDLDLLIEATKAGVRFLDNVIEVTNYPLEAQREEEFSKRRIGLGITGLGTMFAELGIRYGSVASERTASQIMKTIAHAAYTESSRLASIRENFPLFTPDIVDNGFINQRFDESMKDMIISQGLRNGVILTVAPVGTGSIALGNISSGLEPDFAHEYKRNVRQNNTEEFKEYVEKSYTKRFYEFCTERQPIPDYMATALNLEIIDHIKIQGAVQKWVDASVSKTINIPKDYPYEKFVEVYSLAYQYGCKGCTTYRPSDHRLSILSTSEEGSKLRQVEPKRRGEELSGTTYKIKWPSLSSSMFVTINYMDDEPYEIFFASKDAKFQDWMTGLTLMISNLLRTGADPRTIPYELQQVKSTHDTSWDRGRYYGSLVARIGATIEADFVKHGIMDPTQQNQRTIIPVPNGETKPQNITGDLCPACTQPTYIHKEGCGSCLTCGYSSCS